MSQTTKWCRIERFFDHEDCLEQDIQNKDQILSNLNSVIICFINNLFINLNDLSVRELPHAGEDIVDSMKAVKISNHYIAISQYFKNSQQTRLSLLKYKIQIKNTQSRPTKAVEFVKSSDSFENDVTMMNGMRLIEPAFYFDLNLETIQIHFSNQ